MHKIILIILISVILFPSCNEEGNSYDKEVVTIGEKVLKASDLEKVIPKESTREDSIRIAEDYVQRWIRNQLMVKKAKENLTDKQKNLSKEMEEYKNSLLIFRYQQALLSEKMDTIVSDEEIEDYYKEYPGNFVLAKNIVQGTFIQVPLDVADQKKIKQLAVSEDDDEMKKLDVYCVQYARKYDHFNGNWADFENIASNLPISINDARNFIRKHKTFEVKDSTDFYFVVLKNFKLKGQIAPIEFVGDRIKSMILNRRKIEFIQDLEKNIYDEALKEKTFKINN